MADDAESVVEKCGWSGACVVCALSDVNELTLIDCLGGGTRVQRTVNLLFCLTDDNPCRFVSGERWQVIYRNRFVFVGIVTVNQIPLTMMD